MNKPTDAQHEIATAAAMVVLRAGTYRARRPGDRGYDAALLAVKMDRMIQRHHDAVTGSIPRYKKVRPVNYAQLAALTAACGALCDTTDAAA